MNYQPLFNALNDLGCPPPLQTEMDGIIEICERMNPKVQVSQVMYRAIKAICDADKDGFSVGSGMIAQCRAALAMADNTSELLPCPHSCGPSDWYEGGKCDENGCFFKTNETT